MGVQTLENYHSFIRMVFDLVTEYYGFSVLSVSMSDDGLYQLHTESFSLFVEILSWSPLVLVARINKQFKRSTDYDNMYLWIDSQIEERLDDERICF